MKFIIQHNLINSDQLEKIRTAILAYPHEFVGIIPFSREITSDQPLMGRDWIPYGSTLLTTLAFEQQWKGLYFDLTNFSMVQAFANRDDMMNVGGVLTIREAIAHFQLTDERDVFVRPDLDLKHFSGQVINTKECADWFKSAMECDTSGSYKMDADMLVCVSEPKNIQAEFRWFVVDNQVVSGSMYRCNGQMRQQRCTERELVDEANRLAQLWTPSRNCVMDLALVNDEVKVIEFNCINSSGMYDNDVPAIFDALYQSAVNQ